MQILLSYQESKSYLNWAFPFQVLIVDLINGRSKNITKGVYKVMYQHQVDHKMKMVISNPVDRYGNPALVDGVPVWQLSDASYGELVVAADGYSADFTPIGVVTPAGVALQVNVTADADLGDGIKPITSRGEFALVAGEATGLVIGFSDGGQF